MGSTPSTRLVSDSPPTVRPAGSGGLGFVVAAAPDFCDDGQTVHVLGRDPACPDDVRCGQRLHAGVEEVNLGVLVRRVLECWLCAVDGGRVVARVVCCR